MKSTKHVYESEAMSMAVCHDHKKTYLPADSKYIDNGRLDDSENDRAACNNKQSPSPEQLQNVQLFS